MGGVGYLSVVMRVSVSLFPCIVVFLRLPIRFCSRDPHSCSSVSCCWASRSASRRRRVSHSVPRRASAASRLEVTEGVCDGVPHPLDCAARAPQHAGEHLPPSFAGTGALKCLRAPLAGPPAPAERSGGLCFLACLPAR